MPPSSDWNELKFVWIIQIDQLDQMAYFFNPKDQYHKMIKLLNWSKDQFNQNINSHFDQIIKLSNYQTQLNLNLTWAFNWSIFKLCYFVDFFLKDVWCMVFVRSIFLMGKESTKNCVDMTEPGQAINENIA